MQMALIMDYPDILAWMKGLIGPGKRFPRIAAQITQAHPGQALSDIRRGLFFCLFSILIAKK